MNEHFVLDYIPFGSENAVTRQHLSSLLHLSDRAVRKLIEEARKDGAIIINRQDGRGYYRSEDREDLRAQYRQNRARAMNILHQQTHLRRRLREMGEKV